MRRYLNLRIWGRDVAVVYAGTEGSGHKSAGQVRRYAAREPYAPPGGGRGDGSRLRSREPVEDDPDYWRGGLLADETWDFVVEFFDPADGRTHRVGAASLFQFPAVGDTVRASMPTGRPNNARALVAPGGEIALYVMAAALGVITAGYGLRLAWRSVGRGVGATETVRRKVDR